MGKMRDNLVQHEPGLLRQCRNIVMLYINDDLYCDNDYQTSDCLLYRWNGQKLMYCVHSDHYNDLSWWLESSLVRVDDFLTDVLSGDAVPLIGVDEFKGEVLC